MSQDADSPLYDAVISVPAADVPASALAIPAADAVALSLVFLLGFCLGCFAWAAAILSKREKHSSNADSSNAEMPPSHSNSSISQAEPHRGNAWEREADWWKK